MTLAVQNVSITYNGNSSTVDFTIPFAFAASSEVEVIATTAAGVETVKTIATHYTIATTIVTMLVAPATGTFLTIRQIKDIKQQVVDFADNVPFLATTVEAGDDNLAALLQQLDERIDRCLTFPRSSALTKVELPRTLTSMAGYVPSVNTAETGFEFAVTVDQILAAIAAGAAAAVSAASASASASSASTSASAASASATAAAASASAASTSAANAAAAAAGAVGTAKQEVLTGTYAAGNTTYTLTQTPNAAAGVLAILGTNPQAQGTDYTISSTTITFTAQDTTASNLLVLYRY